MWRNRIDSVRSIVVLDETTRSGLHPGEHLLDPAGDADAFATANHVLGTAIGETGGYLLTATRTGLVLAGGRGSPAAGSWCSGAARPSFILAGLLVPLGLLLADTADFVSDVLWSGWLVAFGVVLSFGPAAARAWGPAP